MFSLLDVGLAVAGASQDRSRYGNKVFRAIVASGRTVYPLTPTAIEVESQPAFASMVDLPVVPESLSIVTPPHVTRQVIQQAIVAGVKNIWMQPGAEDSKGSQAALDAGLNVIYDGSCILVKPPTIHLQQLVPQVATGLAVRLTHRGGF